MYIIYIERGGTSKYWEGKRNTEVKRIEGEKQNIDDFSETDREDDGMSKYIYIYIHTHVYMCVYICMCVYIYNFIYTYTHIMK